MEVRDTHGIAPMVLSLMVLQAGVAGARGAVAEQRTQAPVWSRGTARVGGVFEGVAAGAGGAPAGAAGGAGPAVADEAVVLEALDHLWVPEAGADVEM